MGALEGRSVLGPEHVDDVDPLLGDLIAVAVVALRVEPHLGVLAEVRPGDDVDAEATAADVVDRGRHLRGDRGVQRERDHRGDDLDPLGHGSDPGHHGDRLKGVVPVLGLAVEPTPLDRREEEVEADLLGQLSDALVEVEGRHVLRSVPRDDPAVVEGRHEDAQLDGLAH